MRSITQYFNDLNVAVGAGWNRFWFTPTRATTLGAVRVGAGLLALFAVATYAPDLERWFASDGMLPMSLIRDLYRPEGQLLGQRSVLDALPDGLLWPAYWTALGVIGLYILGIGGRAVAVGATVATVSFFTRAPLVIGEFEHVLAMLMIYLCLGRCCDAFSVRSLFKRSAAPSPPHRPARRGESPVATPSPQSPVPNLPSPLNTVSLRLIQVHLAIIHLMMGYAQLAVPESAWWSGEGVWLAAARPGMSLVDLSALVDHPRIVAVWSHAITLYLLAFPVLVWRRLARPLMLAWGAAVWTSFAVASGWTALCLVMLTGLAAYIEPPSASSPR